MIISITGEPGAGNSTVGKMLADKLGFEFYSMGEIRRKMAEEKGMTIHDFNKLGETDPSTDKEVDMYAKKLGEEKDNFVIDGKIAFHFIPHSFKVYLKVDPEESARRISAEARTAEQYDSPEEAIEATKKRKESDKRRYNKWYGIDQTDQTNYNLIVDTTNKTQEEVVKLIFDHLKK